MPHTNSLPTDKLAFSILQLDKTVANAYHHINQLFTIYENNISGILKRLNNQENIDKGEDAGRNFTQQQYTDHKIYVQLLLDQKTAFTEFNIALKQILSKMEKPSIARQKVETANIAKASGMTPGEVAFYRNVGSYHYVGDERADQHNLKNKALFDLRKSDPEAFKNHPMIAALSKIDQELAGKLMKTDNINDFIPMLIEAMTKANQKYEENPNDEKAQAAVVEGKKWTEWNANLWALWTDIAIKVGSDRVETAKKQTVNDDVRKNDYANMSNSEVNLFNARQAQTASGAVAVSGITNQINNDKANEINKDDNLEA